MEKKNSKKYFLLEGNREVDCLTNQNDTNYWGYPIDNNSDSFEVIEKYYHFDPLKIFRTRGPNTIMNINGTEFKCSEIHGVIGQ